jgi:hypothetical protein
MVIAKNLLDKWKVLRSPEDTAKLVELMPGSYAELFQRAFRDGKCNDDVFKVMADYYKQKAELIKEYL